MELIPVSGGESWEGISFKYGEERLGDPPAMTPERFQARVELMDRFDQHFTKTWLDFVGGIHRRHVLDTRTYYLVLVGQFTVTNNYWHLEDALRGGLADGVSGRDLLEAILLCQVYAGDTAVAPALEVFARVADSTGLAPQVMKDQLDLDGHDNERSYDEESARWSDEEAGHPRREELMDTHGWRAVATGIRYRGLHHLNLLAHRNDIDAEWASLWVGFGYGRMYSRWILDDAARIICTVGDTIAVGDVTQAKAHMTEAMKFGLDPRQILEVIYLVGCYFGLPRMAAALKLFEGVMDGAGRLDEIVKPTD